MLKEIVEKVSSKYEVYFVKDTLWLAYGQGSGTTSYMPNIKKALSNKSGDRTYDFIVDRILEKYVPTHKPMKTNKDKSVLLYEIPYYELTSYGTYDIWGGDIKPKKKMYMVISTSKSGLTVINIFDNKNEALAWMRSTV